MIPELGHFALAVALAVALLQATLPLIGSLANIPAWIAVARPAAMCQLMLLAVAYSCLTYAFITGDFSVAYIAANSNSHLPMIYRIAGVWGGHEGSLLLWSFILALWSGAVARFSSRMPDVVTARVLSVMAMISVGFLLFILFTSNPFTRLLPPPPDGNDLNPLLQDIGLAVHPPMLYLGYVGFSVAFAFAIAALIGGRLDGAWARWARPWTNIAWMFLTIGIALGSWWAYYELGWGGWWFWDPVENASFMPWLAGTALIHSLAATEKRGVFKAWTVLLAVCAFSLSLLGTFLVRSGVLTSVHAFATDPARGLFILIFLAVVVGGSLMLYAWRAPRLISRAQFGYLSREMAILLNNLLLVVLCCAVLLGTLYPLILDALSGKKISVGAPYFNFLFAILGSPLAVLVGIGAWLRWKQDAAARFGLRLILPAVLSIAVGAAVPWIFMRIIHVDSPTQYSPGAAIGVGLGCWIVLTALLSLRDRVVGRARIPLSLAGMTVAHIGVGMFIIGVACTNVYSVEKDLRLAAGESYHLAGYRFTFTGVADKQGANYQSQQGKFIVTRQQKPVAQLYPEKRTYLVQQNPMTEAAIDPGLTRDLYVALGEPLDDGDVGNEAWSVRIYYKPLIRWIWLGALLMAAGGLLAATDPRYRNRHPKSSPPRINIS